MMRDQAFNEASAELGEKLDVMRREAREWPPPEPTIGSMMSPEQFPGAGFFSGNEIDGDAMNAYAEIVGWRCRFVEVAPGRWQIGYPTTPAEVEAMRSQSAATARLRSVLIEHDRELAAEVRRLRAGA